MCAVVIVVVTRIALAPIVIYRRLISPFIAPRCRYHPTCSSYAVEAIGELGLLRGGVLAAWRLARCNPWSPGGIDAVADRRLFTHVRGTRREARQCFSHDTLRIARACGAGFVDFLMSTLESIHTALPLSWGWSIVVFTCVVRLVLVPLAAKQTKSMLVMQRLHVAANGPTCSRSPASRSGLDSAPAVSTTDACEKPTKNQRRPTSTRFGWAWCG